MMKPRPQGKIIFLAITFCALVAAGWLLWREYRTATEAMILLAQKRQEREWLCSRSPALSRVNELAIAQDVASASRELAAMQAGLPGTVSSLFASPPPATSIEAYVDLATFKERLRIRATRARVGLKAGEEFGFATYATEGPAANAIPVVHQQRIAVQILIETLWESAPATLLAVRRERPKIDPTRDQQSRPQDFFQIPDSLSLRQDGKVVTEAFRVEFTGQTMVLRGFLSKLAGSDQPFVVRSVEVEPVVMVSATEAKGAGTSVTAQEVLARQHDSRFTVTLELILRADTAARTSG